MSIPPRLASKLHEVIGASATEDLVNWLDDSRAQHVELRADIAELRQEMRVGFGAMPAQLAAHSAQLETRLGERLAALTTDLRKEINAVDNKIEKRFSDLLLWSFVFWVGAVGAIAMLARVLRG
jgi:hypothetical protein